MIMWWWNFEAATIWGSDSPRRLLELPTFRDGDIPGDDISRWLQLLWTLDIIFKVCKNFVSTSSILESRNVSNLCQCPRETQRLHLRDKAFVLALIMPASERTRETLRGETETGSYINLSELHCALAHRFALKLTACPGRSWFLKFFCRSFTTLSTREWSLVCLHF